jgi:hypothetical protein
MEKLIHTDQKDHEFKDFDIHLGEVLAIGTTLEYVKAISVQIFRVFEPCTRACEPEPCSRVDRTCPLSISKLDTFPLSA